MKWALLISFVNPDDPKVFEPHMEVLTEVPFYLKRQRITPFIPGCQET